MRDTRNIKEKVAKESQEKDIFFSKEKSDKYACRTLDLGSHLTKRNCSKYYILH